MAAVRGNSKSPQVSRVQLSLSTCSRSLYTNLPANPAPPSLDSFASRHPSSNQRLRPRFVPPLWVGSESGLEKEGCQMQDVTRPLICSPADGLMRSRADARGLEAFELILLASKLTLVPFFPFLVQPGRVVTLQEDYNGCTWGVAYELHGDQVAASLKYLNVREAVLGGYVTKLVKFYPQEKESKEPILALVYIATPQNPSYLGPASEEDIAAQIIVSSGRAGHNIEYLLQLADFMRYCCPQVEDEHLFSIEEALISILPFLYHAEESTIEELM
ncbi:hypothetical protein JD844_021262 [Phrynosoma platyrhinos]|uniref:Gamma-glutamylcyclotransferase n=1 Tax=Phrynosoma platyrhinos TaxID=52577 RepID=A0ABQ7STM9_PHRPL|nr:hypothetical protein JD844_021262 [Phrynosoma platyrhinos]